MKERNGWVDEWRCDRKERERERGKGEEKGDGRGEGVND